MKGGFPSVFQPKILDLLAVIKCWESQICFWLGLDSETIVISLLIFSDQSAKGTEVKKIILKIYHALTQYILPMELIPKETFVQWMEILKTVVEQEMPGTYYLFCIQRF